MKNVFQTKDGEIFSTPAEALDHEKSLFIQWLATDEAEPFRNLGMCLDNTHEDEYYGSARGLLYNLLQHYWSKLK